MHNLKISMFVFGFALITLIFTSAMTTTTTGIPSALANPNCDPEDDNYQCPPNNNNDDNHGSDVKNVANLKVREGIFHGLDVSTFAKSSDKPVNCNNPDVVC